MKTQSQTFDLNRFSKCFKRDMALNGRSWLLKALIMLGVMTLTIIAVTSPGDVDSINYYGIHTAIGNIMFRFFGSLFCALGASMFMENMTTKGMRLNSLMSPASALEKFLSRWIICVFGVTIAFIVSFILADYISIAVFSLYYGHPAGLRYVGPFEIIGLGEHRDYWWAYLATVQAIFVLGSTVTPKNAFRKTLGFLIILLVVFFFAAGNIFSALAPHHFHYVTDDTAESIINIGYKILIVCIIPFCYITAYFRLKESEIIHRL